MSITPRFLLVDDDREVRLGVADLLSNLGLEILQVESGAEAVELVRAETIHAALLDMYMPGQTGLETLPMLMEARADLPCLVYSGRWTQGLEDSALAAGARACLKKPVEPDALRQEVLRALGMRPNEPWFPGNQN